MTRFILALLCACVCGCAEVQQSAGKAFDNANSVVSSSREKMWSKDSAGPKDAATAEQDKKEGKKEEKTTAAD